jgi:hypothetical protein
MNYNIPKSSSFNFFKEAFTKNFTDLDGDSPCEVVIISLPDPFMGQLNYNGKKVEIDMCFPVSNANLLSFFRLTNEAINTSFNFVISDNNQNKQYSNMATVTLNIGAYTNQAPSQVGDLSVTMAHAATKVFSVADFTTGLTPPYADPEGDAPSKLKILTLPSSGLVKLNGVNVTVNQEIPFANISSGLLTYVSDGSTLTVINTSFDFSISDTGSGIFTS